MRPYGERKKIKTNIPDVHPQKDDIMWWKVEWDDVNKGRERQKAKKLIKKEINEQ